VLVHKPHIPLTPEEKRFADAAERAAKRNPNTVLLDKFNGFEAHLKAISSSEEAQKRFEAARQAERARDERIRAALNKEER
jgi:membrane glycosyltransferase